MKLLGLKQKLGLTFCLLMTSTACSVYKSQGRKNFESNAPASTAGVSSVQTNDHQTETCWTQSANEALWQVDPGVPLYVEKISDTEIQVCNYNTTATSLE